MPRLTDAAVDDVVAVDRRVDHRVPAQAIDRGLGDERREGELGAGALVLVLLRLADLVDAAVVHLEHRVDVRRGVLAEHHVLGDLLAHHRHRLDAIRRPCASPAAGVGRRRARRGGGHRSRGTGAAGLDERQDVALGDAAADARSGDPRRCRRCVPSRCGAPAATSSGARPTGALVGRGRGGVQSPPAAVPERPPAPPQPLAAAAIRLRRGRRGRAQPPQPRRASRRLRPSSPIVATTLLTGTVSPSFTEMSSSDAGRRRGDLRVHLVGGDLEQRLVAIDGVADLLDPADDGAFGDRLAHLRHDYGCGHGGSLRLSLAS